MDKIIVPYVQDEEHNAPKYLRPQAYSQVHLSTAYVVDTMQEGNRDDRG